MAFTVKLITSPTVETGIHVGNSNALLSPKNNQFIHIMFNIFQNVDVESYHHQGNVFTGSQFDWKFYVE